MIAVKTTKLKNHKVMVVGGYVLMNGFALANDEGKLFSSDGVFPYYQKNKAVIDMIARDGIIEGALFI